MYHERYVSGTIIILAERTPRQNTEVWQDAKAALTVHSVSRRVRRKGDT